MTEELGGRERSPSNSARVSERKAEGKIVGGQKDDDSNVKLSSSRAIHAQAIEGEGRERPSKKDPSVYKVQVEGGKGVGKSKSKCGAGWLVKALSICEVTKEDAYAKEVESLIG